MSEQDPTQVDAALAPASSVEAQSPTAIESTAEVKPISATAQKKLDAAAKKVEKEQKKAEADAAKAADKAAKDAEREAKKAAAATPVEKDSKNGISRPTAGITQRIWIVADEMSHTAGKPVERSALTAALEAEKINVGTIHTQFGRWKKYYGLTESKEDRATRLAAAKEVREAAAAEKKAVKEAKALAAQEAAAQKALELEAQGTQPPAAPVPSTDGTQAVE